MSILSTIFQGRKKRLYRKIDAAVDQVKHGTYNYFFIDYLNKYDRDFAGQLAAAVVNELFAEKPVDDKGKNFLKENRKIVDEELSRVIEFEEASKMVSEAILLKSTIIYSHLKSGDYDRNGGKAILRLKKLGILKGEHKTRPVSTFISGASKYFGRSLKKVKYL